jgi:hypothetical protein
VNKVETGVIRTSSGENRVITLLHNLWVLRTRALLLGSCRYILKS